MDELSDFPDETLQVAEHLMFRTAIRALLDSHPDPKALRASWDHKVSMFWRDYAANYAEMAPEASSRLADALKILQPVWETYLSRE